MDHRRAAEPKGGGASLHHEKTKRGKVSGRGGLVFSSSGNSPVAYLVRIWRAESDDVGSIQSTTARKHQSIGWRRAGKKFKRSSGIHFVASTTQRELCAGTLVVLSVRMCVSVSVCERESESV